MAWGRCPQAEPPGPRLTRHLYTAAVNTHTVLLPVCSPTRPVRYILPFLLFLVEQRHRILSDLPIVLQRVNGRAEIWTQESGFWAQAFSLWAPCLPCRWAFLWPGRHALGVVLWPPGDCHGGSCTPQVQVHLRMCLCFKDRGKIKYSSFCVPVLLLFALCGLLFSG